MFDVLKKMEGQQLSEEAVAEACYSDSTVDYNYLQEEQSLSDCDGSTVDTSDAQEKQLSGHDGSTVDTSDEESADSGAIQIKFSDPLQERAMIALFGKDWRNPAGRSLSRRIMSVTLRWTSVQMERTPRQNTKWCQ